MLTLSSPESVNNAPLYELSSNLLHSSAQSFIHLSIHLSIYLSIYLTIYLSIYRVAFNSLFIGLLCPTGTAKAQKFKWLLYSVLLNGHVSAITPRALYFLSLYSTPTHLLFFATISINEFSHSVSSIFVYHTTNFRELHWLSAPLKASVFCCFNLLFITLWRCV